MKVRQFAGISILVAILLSAVLSGGCSITSLVDVNNAEKALKNAEKRGAEEKAPYEYYMAKEMYRKATEEWGYSEFEKTSYFAAQAIAYANKAEKKAIADPWKPPKRTDMKLIKAKFSTHPTQKSKDKSKDKKEKNKGKASKP